MISSAYSLHWKRLSTVSGYVMDLQRFDELLKQAQQNSSITIEKNMIVGIDNKVFEI